MTFSFIHSGGSEMASYRLRVQQIAPLLGYQEELCINNASAETLIFSKPAAEEVAIASAKKAAGGTVIVDFCDDHFDRLPHYRQMAELADWLVCPTEVMRLRLCDLFPPGDVEPVTVIPDAYEYPEVEPHCSGANLLWFGHSSNLVTLFRVIRLLDDYPLMIVSNAPMAMPWNYNEMQRQFRKADIVVLPATASYKSANRAVESVRQGCFVVAEEHPALKDFPGIWVGNIKEGIEWASQNPLQSNAWIKRAQNHVRERYSPRTLADAWKKVLDRAKSASTSAAVASAGLSGSALTDSTVPQT